MTTTDLPQLSLQRYVDLVKRRRWQLIPVSLLGLLVGGLVAFFIPRYFVAETLIVHQQVGSGTNDRDNPFRQIVDTAISTIPLSVGLALDQVKWNESQGLDDFERDQLEREIESRVRVVDKNAYDKTRNYSQLLVQFRDRDGDRSANFLNELVEVWIEKRIEDLRQPAKEQSRLAKERADVAYKVWQGYLNDKLSLERQYSFDPEVSISLQMRSDAAAQARKAQLNDDYKIKRGKIGRLDRQIARLEEELAELPARVPAEAGDLLKAAQEHPQARYLVAGMLQSQGKMRVFLPNTRLWNDAKRSYDQSLRLIQEMLPRESETPDGMILNKAHQLQSAKLEELKAEREQLQAEADLLEEEIEAERKRLADRIEGYRLYSEKLKQLQEAEDDRERALADLAAAEVTLSKLERDRPVKVQRPALVPPAPTEPNIMVVALIGCILGLGVAVGLILAFDVLQGTYKTIDDVDRGLPVPVLGGVSHLETEEERVQLSRSRRRATFAAAAALLLVTVVVTVFYVDPTRLPPVVRDILAMLLGT
ncbi:MAG: hypothetical protein AB8H80_20470 [Planctomycetota bacterium]